MPTDDDDGPVTAINFLSLKPGATLEEFRRFSGELDQPVCLAQDVVSGFDAYAVTRRGSGRPDFDVVELMTVRSWREWERVRDGLEALTPVTAAFDRLIVGDSVRTVFATRIPPQP